MSYIDCDSHVVEGAHTWAYLADGDRQFEPKLITHAEPMYEDPNGAAPPSRSWLIGDTWIGYHPADGNRKGNANVFSPGALQLTDLSARLADMDALGIDAQLLISSMFIGLEISYPQEEVAITRCYNRWLADRVGRHDRLPWTMSLPLKSIEVALKEMEYCKDRGAAGIQVRGTIDGFYLSDPYFYPVYERAQDLDLAIVVHVGEAIRRIPNQRIGTLIRNQAAFLIQIMPMMCGFHAVLGSDMHKRFPRLRWGFVEGGATWVPTVIQQHRRLVASGTEFLQLPDFTPEILEEKNVFVACEADEDIPYLLSVVGENVLCAGSDYGHNDIGSEPASHATIDARTDISREVAAKILESNGRKLLGLSTSSVVAKPPHPIPEWLPNVSGASTPDGRPLVSSGVPA